MCSMVKKITISVLSLLLLFFGFISNDFSEVQTYNYGVNKYSDCVYSGDCDIQISLSIRNSDDTADKNTCNLGTLTTSSVASCSYRIKPATNAENGYTVLVATQSGLNIGGYSLSNAAVGTGAEMALGVLDPQFKANMSESEAVELAKKAVRSASLRDSASGDGVDIMIITDSGITESTEKIAN